MDNATQQKILKLTENAGAQADVLVGSMIREHAKNPEVFDKRLDLLDKRVNEIRPEKIIPGIPDIRYNSANNLTVADPENVSIVEGGLRSIADYMADIMLRNAPPRTNNHNFFDANQTFGMLENNLKDLKKIQELTGMKDGDMRVPNGAGGIRQVSFNDATASAREYYAFFATFRDAFPDEFSKKGEQHYKTVMEQTKGQSVSQDNFIKEMIGRTKEKLGNDGFASAFQKHVQEFSTQGLAPTVEQRQIPAATYSR